MTMCRRSRRLSACIAGMIWMALLALYTPTLAQQPGEQTVALVRVSDYTATQPSSALLQFDGAGNQVGPKTPLDASTLDMFVSNDGQWIALLKSDPNTHQQSLEYRPATASQSTVIQADNNASLFYVIFSHNSQYLLYAMAKGNPPAVHWLTGIVELASGARAEYIGTVSIQSNSNVPFTGMPWPIDFDGSRLLFTTVLPNSDAFPAGLYSVEIGGFKVGASLALPEPVKSWHHLPYPLISPQLSPDGTRLLYLFDNPANPPANYEPMGMSFTFNSLGVIDLNAGTDTVIAQAGKGQALEVADWWYTGDFAIFTGGDYQHSDRIISPRFFSVDARSGQVTNTPPIYFTDNPQESVIDMLACSSGLFYVTQIGNETRTETLYVAPLKDPHAGKKLLSGTNVHYDVRKCLPS